MTDVTNTQKRGKSSKATQHKSKKVRSAVPAGPKSIIPVNLYISECCHALGKKVPLVRSTKDKEENKLSENHLGVFRCSQCNGHSSFSRVPNTKGEAISL